MESLPVSDELHGVVARQEEEQRRRLVAAITPLSTDPIPATNVVHEVAIGTQTPQSVSLTLAVGVEHLAAVAAHGEGNLAADPIVRRAFPPDLNGVILKIADDMRSMVPLLQQLVDAQATVGGNVGASVVRLSPDAPRIAELTAALLDEELRLSQPRAHAIEQHLRVGDLLLRSALEGIQVLLYGVISGLIVEAMLHPDETQQRMQAIVNTIEHVLTRLL
jgi:hypothetical protein